MKDLVARARAMLTAPEAEWRAVAGEADDSLLPPIRYAAVLAIVPAVAGVIGSTLIGGYAPLLLALTGAVLNYASNIVTLFAIASFLAALAPVFAAEPDFSNALKLAAYASTPVWLAGIFLIVPGLSFFSILGLYGLYLLWLGLPPLLQVPSRQRLPFAGAVAVFAIVLNTVLGITQSGLAGVLR